MLSHLFLSLFRCFLLLVSWTLFLGVNAGHVMIEDTDLSIKYVGYWAPAIRPGRFSNNTHYTSVKGSSASLTFTGATMIQVMGDGFVDPTIDSSVGIVFDDISTTVSALRDVNHAIRQSLWTSGTLDPATTHTVTCIKISENGGGRDLNLDAFYLTTPDGTSVPIVRATPTTSPSSVTARTPLTPTSSTSMTDVVVVAAANYSTLSDLDLGASIANSDIPPSTFASSTISISASGNIDPGEKNGISQGAKIGIAVCAVIFVCLVAAILFLLRQRRRLLGSNSGPGASTDIPDAIVPMEMSNHEWIVMGRPTSPLPSKWRLGTNTTREAEAVPELSTHRNTRVISTSQASPVISGTRDSSDEAAPPAYSAHSHTSD